MYMTKVDIVAYCRRDTLHAFDIKFINCVLVIYGFAELAHAMFQYDSQSTRDVAPPKKSCFFFQFYSSLGG